MRRALRVTCIATAAILLLMMILSGCSRSPDYSYDGWKKIEIPKYGTIKVPESWMLCEKDGKLYLTDKPMEEADRRLYFFQLSFRDPDDLGHDTTIFGEDVRLVEPVSYEKCDSYAVVFTRRVDIDGFRQTISGFALDSDSLVHYIYFYTLDADVSEETIRKIANSFEMFE